MNEIEITPQYNTTKNATRLASILGTWIVKSDVKTDIGHFRLQNNFIVHFACNAQQKGNECSLPGCSEIENQVCLLDNHTSYPRCHEMEGTVVDWSDTVAFIHYTFQLDAGRPWNSHQTKTTAGWVGPLHIIWAQNNQTERLTSDDSRIVDSYVAKFVYAPNTPFLKRPTGANIVPPEDYNNYLGPKAVQQTVNAQVESGSDFHKYDPFAKYYKTCDNGDAKPVFPFVQFDFLQNDKIPGKETLNIKLKYKLLSIPTSDLPMYRIFPQIQKHLKAISGPYCYGNDPKRGYGLDYDFDSAKPDKYAKLHHSCVEGLPCIPPAIQECNCSTMNTTDVAPDDSSTTINLSTELYLIISVVVLSLGLIAVLVMNVRLRKKNQDLQTKNQKKF